MGMDYQGGIFIVSIDVNILPYDNSKTQMRAISLAFCVEVPMAKASISLFMVTICTGLILDHFPSSCSHLYIIPSQACQWMVQLIQSARIKFVSDS